MSSFNVNEYWLERGRNYMEERRTPPEFHRLQERFLLDILKSSGVPMRRVLEIGCGFGRITKLLAETWPQADLTALDLSPEQLANAQRYCGDRAGIQFQQYDFYSGRPLPGREYDAVFAIEVFLHHPREFVVQLLNRLASVARYVVNIDWSEDWPGQLPQHVWVHDYPKLFAEAGLKCAGFALPEKVDGKQQRLFIAARELSEEIIQVAGEFCEQASNSATARQNDDWTQRLRSATSELLNLIPVGSRFILVDEAQWGELRDFARHQVIPFLEREGRYWGLPPDDGVAISEVERLRQLGASYIAFAWPSFWWLEHYAALHRYLRSSFPQVLTNERLVVYQLKQ